MGLYRDRVFPRIVNVVMNTKQTNKVRAEVCAPLAGDILEIGFGTGLNLPYIPDAVTRLRAVDPMQRGQRLAAKRIEKASVPVEFVGLDGESLPVEDDSVDAVLATWTICSIPDPVAAMREVARVLRPGGTFHFAEHGRAPDENVRRRQERFNGFQQRVACGCHLNRDIPAIVELGGLTVDHLDMFYAKGEPKFLGWTYQGIASAH